MTVQMDLPTRLPISVVVPTYNAAETIARAFDSILAQEYQPVEIILVDDGSTDHTWEILQTLSSTHSEQRVKIIRFDENLGVASARNAGWELATQEYVAFLDADDAWHPRKLELQYKWMSAHPNVVLCGHQCAVMAHRHTVPDLNFEMLRTHDFGLNSFLLWNRLSTPSVMLRRSIVERFDARKRYSEDYLLWMQIVATHGAACFINLPLAYLFKAKYGASGLSGQLWQMQLGEIDTFSRLCQGGILGRHTWLFAVIWSWTKFARRIVCRPFITT